MNKIEVLLNEYSNLWQEKLVHKQSIRKLKGYISYLTSILSLSLTFMGMSTTDIFKAGLNNAALPSFIKNFSDIFVLISIPFTPIVLLIASFAFTDLFHIYVIGTQIGSIEKRINALSGSTLLKWEHMVCPIVYGEGRRGNKEKDKRITNIIKLSDFLIFFPFVASLCLVTLFFGGKFIFEKNLFIFIVYTGINLYFLTSFICIGAKLLTYTKADSLLEKAITASNNKEEK